MKTLCKWMNQVFFLILMFTIQLPLTQCETAPELETLIDEASDREDDEDDEDDDDDDDDDDNIFVMAGAPEGGKGTKKKPYNSWAEVESNSIPGDKITVLYSESILDGGIALKEGQHLHGKKGKNGQYPKITNSDTEYLDGDAIRLIAGNNEVDNLHIVDVTRLGISSSFDDKAGDFYLHDLLITDYGVRGIELALELSNNEILEGTIERVTMRDGRGGGISVFTDSDDGRGGTLNVDINRIVVKDVDANYLTNAYGLRFTPMAHTQMNVEVTNSELYNLRNPLIHGEGILFTPGTNGVSSLNGIYIGNPFFLLMPEAEIITGLKSSLTVRNVKIRDVHHDEGIQILTLLPRETEIAFRFEDNRVQRTLRNGISYEDIDFVDLGRDYQVKGTIKDNLVQFAGRNGIHLESIARNSMLNGLVKGNTVENVSFDGLALLNEKPNVIQHIEVINNTVKNSGGAGYWMVNRATGSIHSLNLLVEDNDFIKNDQGIFLMDEVDANHGTLQFDFGGGSGSDGHNRFVRNAVDAFIADFHVIAENNWWGNKTGPVSIILDEGGFFDYNPFLKSDPHKDDDDDEEEDDDRSQITQTPIKALDYFNLYKERLDRRKKKMKGESYFSAATGRQ